MSADLTTTEKKAWEKASCIEEQDPDKMRQDKDEIWMDRNMYNVVGLGGWVVDSHGNAVAYRMSGYPAMGDTPLSSRESHLVSTMIMADLKSIDNLHQILGFLVPGLIVIFVRAQFVTGWRPSHSTTILSYFTISVIYYALALPFVDCVFPVREPGDGKVLAWFTLIFFGPAALGLILGINTQKNLVFRALQRLHLNPVHSVPTAWDWKFGRGESQWVFVTLKDGTRFGGFHSSESFVSSDPNERDIYIQWLYDIDDENKWHSRGDKSVLITSGQVKTIEFWPYKTQENPSEQE